MNFKNLLFAVFVVLVGCTSAPTTAWQKFPIPDKWNEPSGEYFYEANGYNLSPPLNEVVLRYVALGETHYFLLEVNGSAASDSFLYLKNSDGTESKFGHTGTSGQIYNNDNSEAKDWANIDDLIMALRNQEELLFSWANSPFTISTEGFPTE